MTTSRSERFPITPSTAANRLAITPGSRVLKSPLTEEVMWTRLKESGFDEQSSKKRDKAALIAYIAKLESEVYDYQPNMGLIILEKVELLSKYERVKASVDLAHRRDQPAYVSALAEAKKREESLKKDVGIAKESISSLEKTLP